jgi:hypothetical protein
MQSACRLLHYPKEVFPISRKEPAMSKGLLFWIIWIFCLLSFVGVAMWGWPSILSAGVMLTLMGLLGWHNFGPPIKG